MAARNTRQNQYTELELHTYMTQKATLQADVVSQHIDATTIGIFMLFYFPSTKEWNTMLSYYPSSVWQRSETKAFPKGRLQQMDRNLFGIAPTLRSSVASETVTQKHVCGRWLRACVWCLHFGSGRSVLLSGQRLSNSVCMREKSLKSELLFYLIVLNSMNEVFLYSVRFKLIQSLSF